MVSTRSSGATLSAGLDRIRRSRRYQKRYKPTDTSHRHRLHDNQRKSVTVRAYKRR